MSPILGIFGSQIAGFDPASISGLKAWYDAADTATISVSGTAVTQWNDKSASAYNLTQGTAARRPISGVNTQNSKNVISFDGNDMLQAATAADWPFMHNATGCTIFFAAFFNTSAVENTVLCTASTTAQAGVFVSKNGSDLAYAEVYRAVGGTQVSGLGAGSLTDNTAKYVSMVLDNANATAANRLIFKINGGSNLTGSTYTASLSTNNPQNPLYIGAYDTAGSGGFNGNICEVIIYSGQLAAGDITSVNSYLASKWAI
jgi:hypothetical protein